MEEQQLINMMCEAGQTMSEEIMFLESRLFASAPETTLCKYYSNFLKRERNGNKGDELEIESEKNFYAVDVLVQR